MQKTRPLAVTILAIWALAASAFMVENMVKILLFWQGNYNEAPFDITGIAGTFALLPLGSGAISSVYFSGDSPAFLDTIFRVSLAAIYAGIGIFTFRGSKVAWLSNVGFSVAGIISVTVMIQVFYNYYSQGMYNPGMMGRDEGQFVTQSVSLYSAVLALAALRLYFLFRQDVRDFFGTNSLFAQKQAA